MSKAKRITYWVATIWLSLGMVSTGVVQLMNGADGPGAAKSMSALGYPAYLLGFLGVAKLAGVLVLLLPRLPLLKEWAYAGFTFLMVGAIYSHIAASDPMVEVFPALLLLVLAFISRYTCPQGRKTDLG